MLFYINNSYDIFEVLSMSKYNISLDLYKIFCTVAKYKNITKAAEELFVTQPSISMALKSLEEKLGCSLFIRSIDVKMF